jgi:hypothetical protein
MERRDFAWTLRLWVRRGSDESVLWVPTNSNGTFCRSGNQTMY